VKVFSFTKDHPFFSVILTFFLTIFLTLTVRQVLADVNVINGCVDNKTGILSIITGTQTCTTKQTPLSWNIQGPPGTSSSNGLPFFCTQFCYFAGMADKFKGHDFTGAQIMSSHFSSGSDLSGVIFKNGFFYSVDFYNTNLTSADFSEVRNQVDTNWEQDVLYIHFNNSDLTNTNFTHSQFMNSSFNGANLQNTNFSNAELRNVDFTGAQNMATATITGVFWSNVTCPDSTNSDNNGNTCVGHF
jgi:uncharacterized protein YjbI with pentapeptide repeats